MFRQRSYNRSFIVQYNERMSRANVVPLFDKVVISILKEQGVDIEYCPQNLYDPEELWSKLYNYDPESAFKLDSHDPFVQAGRNLAFRCFAKPPGEDYLDPIRLDGPCREVFQLLVRNPAASAGLTAYGQTKAEAFSIAMRKVPEVLAGKTPDPTLAGARTQKGKVRLLWMYPYVMTLLEGCVCRPIINHFLDLPTSCIAFGKRSAVIGMEMRRAESHNDYYVGLDASRYDSTISAGVIRMAFSAFRTWFNPEDKVFGDYTVKQVFDIVEEYFIYTPIVMPRVTGPVLVRGKKSGVPSGSYFTQLVDSFQNIMMLGALSKRFHLAIRIDELWVLGDDSLFYTKKRPDLEAYSRFLQNTFGMLVNASKSACGRSVEPKHFLGRIWENGLPFKSFTEVVKWSVAPESYRKYEDKRSEAMGVLWSHRNSSFIRGAPHDFYDTLPYVRLGREIHRSGYLEFLQREGLAPKSYSETLY